MTRRMSVCVMRASCNAGNKIRVAGKVGLESTGHAVAEDSYLVLAAPQTKTGLAFYFHAALPEAKAATPIHACTRDKPLQKIVWADVTHRKHV